MQKKIISFIMSVILMTSVIFVFDFEVNALSGSDVVSQLNSLVSQYNGKTANTNQMYMGSQCKGFANWVFLKIFGVYIGPYPESANYKISNPNAQTLGVIEPGNLNINTAKALLQKGAPGDYIQVQRSTARGRGPHSMILTSVNDTGIEVFDCNSDGKNTIKKYSISWADFDTANRAMSLYRANGYSPSFHAPSNPQISKSQHWFDLEDRIEISAYADGASSYFMSMFKDGHKILSQGVDGGKFSMDAKTYGQGDYSAYFSCSNSAGTVDTQWIDFSVVGPPAYSDVYPSNWWYDLTDTVNIHVDTVCAKGQVIGIDKEGVGRVITEATESTYEIPASKLGIGKYSAYFTVYNGSGGVDTKRITFEIVDIPKKDAAVFSQKANYSLEDDVEISVLVYCSKFQVIGIDRNGTERAVTETITDGTFKIPASKLGRGKYSAYFSVWNHSGGYDTSRIEFAIDHKLTNPAISIEKNIYELNEDVKIFASVDGGAEPYTAILYDQEGKEILSKDFTGHNFSINTSKLGQGIYTVKVICSNYAFHAETEPITFEVTCSHNYISMITTQPTCVSNGIRTYICSDCEKIYTEIIPAAGHIWDAGKVTVKATETTDGLRTYSCISCSATKTEPIPAVNQTGTPASSPVPPHPTPASSPVPPHPTSAPSPVPPHPTSAAPVPGAVKGTRGDVNSDGLVDLKDAQLVLRAALHIVNLSDTEKVAADSNGDGNLTLEDAQMILKMALKIVN